MACVFLHENLSALYGEIFWDSRDNGMMVPCHIRNLDACVKLSSICSTLDNLGTDDAVNLEISVSV